jgi:uncharacterized membrane protein YphA (DoxX/SURF4 family)
MTRKSQRTLGWILTFLVGFFMLIVSALAKFIDYPGKADQLASLQVPSALLPAVACIEIAVALLFLIPRTAFIGAILISGYLGGAVWTHVRIGEPWVFPTILGALAWTALALRYPAFLKHARGRYGDI